MKLYFYSPVPCLVTQNGKVSGKVFRNVRRLNADYDDVFTIYTDGCFPCVASARYTENVTSYDFYYGKLFIPSPRKLPLPYKLIAEKRFTARGSEIYVKLFNDGQTKAEVRFPTKTTTVTLPVDAESVDAVDCGNSLLIKFGEKLKSIFLFSLSDFERIFSATCIDFHIKSGLSVDKLVFCPQPHVYSEFYEITKTAVLSGTSLRPLSAQKCGAEKLSLFTFLCLTLYNGNYAEYLSPAIKDKAGVIKEFLGRPEYILPPVEKDRPYTFALIESGRVKYVDFLTDGDKITDITAEFFLKPLD